jgi:hypothetical protein
LVVLLSLNNLQPTTSSAAGWKGANVLAVLGAIKTPSFGGEKYPTYGEECCQFDAKDTCSLGNKLLWGRNVQLICGNVVKSM